MDRKALIIGLALLAGCVGSRMQSGLNAYVGGPVASLIAKLGYPDGEREIAGAHLYYWTSSHQMFTTLGPLQAQCTLQVAVDEHSIINHWQYQGNNAGCAQFARALNR